MKRLAAFALLVILVIWVARVAWCWTSRYDFSQEAAMTNGEIADLTMRDVVWIGTKFVDLNGKVVGTLRDVYFDQSGKGWLLVDPNMENLDDASIRLLCRSGRVCRIMGHQWNFIPDSRLWECGLCGKQKSHWTDEP